jgi:hypothetical protein
MRSPGGETGESNMAYNNDDKKTGDEASRLKNEEEEEKKPLGEKIHDALQEWSNDDQRDQEFDDTRP